MATGEGLITFLPNNSHCLINNNAVGTAGLQGVNVGRLIQSVDPFDTMPLPTSTFTNRLALLYSDLKASNPYCWYFTGLMPRHYGGRGILISITAGFAGVITYSNPFFVNVAAGFDRLDSLDSGVNIDIPSWSTQTSSTVGLTGVHELQTNQLMLYIPNTSLDGIQAGDLFGMYFTFQNNSNVFNVEALILSLTLIEWT